MNQPSIPLQVSASEDMLNRERGRGDEAQQESTSATG